MAGEQIISDKKSNLIAISLPNMVGISMTYIAEKISETATDLVIQNVAKIVIIPPQKETEPVNVQWQSEPLFDGIDEHMSFPKNSLHRQLDPKKDENLYRSHENFMTRLRGSKSGIKIARTMPPDQKFL